MCSIPRGLGCDTSSWSLNSSCSDNSWWRKCLKLYPIHPISYEYLWLMIIRLRDDPIIKTIILYIGFAFIFMHCFNVFLSYFKRLWSKISSSKFNLKFSSYHFDLTESISYISKINLKEYNIVFIIPIIGSNQILTFFINI